MGVEARLSQPHCDIAKVKVVARSEARGVLDRWRDGDTAAQLRASEDNDIANARYGNKQQSCPMRRVYIEWKDQDQSSMKSSSIQPRWKRAAGQNHLRRR